MSIMYKFHKVMAVTWYYLLRFLDNNTLEHFVYYVVVFTVNAFWHVKTDAIESCKFCIKNNHSLYRGISVIKRIFVP